MVIRKKDPLAVETSAGILREGGIVILPCDTIYGINGLFPETDSRIRSIKGRGETKPFLRLIRLKDVPAVSSSPIPPELLGLWPGPLTLIVACEDGETAGIRVPRDPFIQEILEILGKPLISTSVNRSGSPAVEQIREIIDQFEDEVDLIVDDGDREGALPSTILDITGFPYRIIRAGACILPPFVLDHCITA